MTLKMFSIFDSKAEAYLAPFFCPTAAVAMRNFEQAANDEGHAFHRHSGDYTLFELSEFNDATAELTPLKTPHNLGLAQNFIKPTTPGPTPINQERN